MNKRCRAWRSIQFLSLQLMAWCVLTIAFVSSAGAEEAVEIIDLLPSDAPRTVLAARLSDLVGRPVTLTKAPVDLAESLRWSVPDPARERCDELEDALLTAARGESITLPMHEADDIVEVLLGIVRQRLLGLDLIQANDLLLRMQEWLPCTSSVLAVDQVRDFFLLQAITLYYLEDPGAGAAFGDVLAVDPTPYLGDEYPPRVQRAYLDAVAVHMRVPPLRVDTRLPGGRVFLDGREVKGVVEARPGRHVVQVFGPYDKIRSRLIRLEAADTSSASPIPLVSPAGLGLFNTREAMAFLSDALDRGTPSRWQALAIDRYLARHHRKSVYFALVPLSGAPVTLLTWVRERGLVERREPAKVTARSPLPEERRRVRLGIAMGGRMQGTYFRGLDVHVGNPGRLGYRFNVEFPLDGAVLGAHAAYLPHASSPAQQCSTYQGGEPSDEEIRDALNCLPSAASYAFGVEAGYDYGRFAPWIVRPGLVHEWVYLPEVVPFLPEEGAGYVVHRAWITGGAFSFRISRLLLESSFQLTMDLDLEVGVYIARLSAMPTVIGKLGSALGVSCLF